MRIDTWNLAGRWSPAHEAFLLDLDCDVLLLTEVSERLAVPDHQLHLTNARMAARRRWAGILSRQPIEPAPDPHPATAAARFGDVALWASVLPWRSCGPTPWGDGRHAEKVQRAVDLLRAQRPARAPLIWGGDWNHALDGREYAGSQGGRSSIHALVHEVGQQVPTTHLPHQIDGLLSIDHISVPRTYDVLSSHRVTAQHADGRLSDHDAYVAEVRVS